MADEGLQKGHAPALVYDTAPSGHRGRGAEVIAKLVSGQTLIAPTRQAVNKLIAHRGVLVWQTADYALLMFLVVVVVRRLRLRKTIGLCNRNDITGFRTVRSQSRRIILAALSFFGFASIVHILPPIAGMKPYGDWIYDTEWWDLYASPLPDVWAPLPVAAGKKLILLPGNLSSLKGTEFFLTAAQRAAELNLPEDSFACANHPTPNSWHISSARICFGVVIIPNTISRRAFSVEPFNWACRRS